MKKKKDNYTEKYIQIRFKEDTSFSFNSILNKYGVEVDILRREDNDDRVPIGFNTTKQEDFISSFLNQGYDLISVSEDDKSVTFHLIRYIYDE